MSFWKIMNFSAWALSTIIFLWLAIDFYKAEKELSDKKNSID
jgi:hypothetical protein